MNIFFLLFFYFLIIPPYFYLKHFLNIPKLYLFIYESLLLFLTTINYLCHPTSYLFYCIYMIAVCAIILQSIYIGLLIIYKLYLKLLQKPIKHITLILLVISIICTSYSIYHHYDKQIQPYSIHINKNTTLKSLNSCLISDIHLGGGTHINDIKKLVYTLNKKHYDIIFICGDLYDEGTNPQLLKDALQLLNQLQSTYGTYMISGNHEHFSSLSYIQSSNIHFIDDQYICINNQFNVVGRKDITTHSKNLKTISQGMNTSLPTIVLDHNPRRFLDIQGYGDIQLSGHTHNGQIFPMTSLISLFHDYPYGYYQHNNLQLIVTSGYGSWGFPSRLGSQCEIVEIKFSF